MAATTITHIQCKSRLLVIEGGKVLHSIVLKKGSSVRISDVPRKKRPSIVGQHIVDQNHYE
jgi:hypothetical protein